MCIKVIKTNVCIYKFNFTSFIAMFFVIMKYSKYSKIDILFLLLFENKLLIVNTNIEFKAFTRI